MTIETKKTKIPLLQPLRRHPRYRNLYGANFISSCGTWAQNLAVAWLMTSELHASSILVAMVQTAAYLPIFLFAIFAGTLADLVDRPKYLMVVNSFLTFIALVFTVCLLFGYVSSWLLLGFTFLMGIGTAFVWPAWQASSSSLVEHNEIPSAVTLNSLALNLASVVGPAIGGLLYKVSGGATPLIFFNALSFVGLIALYYQWWKSPHELTVSKDKFIRAFVDGFKIIFSTKQFNILLLNTFILLFGFSAFQALLPLVVKDLPNAGSDTYGFLMGALGLGAAASAIFLPSLRIRLSTHRLLSMAAQIFAVILIILATFKNFYFLLAVIAVGGFAWIAVVSTLNSASQIMFPIELRARAISLYLVIMSGGTAFGSLAWGGLADLVSVKEALVFAAVFLILSPLVVNRWRVVVSV